MSTQLRKTAKGLERFAPILSSQILKDAQTLDDAVVLIEAASGDFVLHPRNHSPVVPHVEWLD